MKPLLLLGSLQAIANFFSLAGLAVGGLLTYGGIRIYRITPKGWAGAVLAGLVMIPGLLILLFTAFSVFSAG